jgi:hypothetical protein
MYFPAIRNRIVNFESSLQCSCFTIKFTYMKPFKLLILPAILATAFLACMPASFDEKLLPGEWQGAKWVVEGQTEEIDASTAVFSFAPDGNYTYTYNDAVEKGKYYMASNELFTTPEGGIKMMVKVQKLTQDSLVFNMNRGGQSETLTLIRK